MEDIVMVSKDELTAQIQKDLSNFDHVKHFLDKSYDIEEFEVDNTKYRALIPKQPLTTLLEVNIEKNSNSVRKVCLLSTDMEEVLCLWKGLRSKNIEIQKAIHAYCEMHEIGGIPGYGSNFWHLLGYDRVSHNPYIKISFLDIK